MSINDLIPEYASWLDYAIATMDTRSLYNQQFMCDEDPERIYDREEMREAAQSELARLRALSELVEKDGEDGELVDLLRLILGEHKRCHPDVYENTNKLIEQALAKAQEAMEADDQEPPTHDSACQCRHCEVYRKEMR